MLAMTAQRVLRESPTNPVDGKVIVHHRQSSSELSSVTAIHTALLTLTPAFLGALRKIAPKRRGNKIPYVVALAVVAVLAVLWSDASTREFGRAKGRQLAVSLHLAPAAKPADAPAPAAVAQTEAPAAVTPAAPVVSASPAMELDEQVTAPVVAPAAKKKTKSAAQSKKPAPRPAVRPTARHSAMLAAQISGAKTRDL